MNPNQTSIPERLAAIPQPSRPVNRWKPLVILVCFCLLVAGAVAVWHYVHVSQQIGKLKDADPAVRQKAATALGRSKSSRAVEPLIIALNDTDPSVQDCAAIALGEIKDPRAVEPLMATFRDAVKNNQPTKDPYGVYSYNDLQTRRLDVAKQAAEALGSLGAPALQDLMAAFRDKDLREYALSGLVKMGSPAVDALAAAMKDPDDDVRWHAANALGDIKDTRAVEPLIEALQVKDLQWHAARSLGEIKDTRAVEPLIAALNDKDLEFREQVALSLGQINDPRAVAPLIALLKAPALKDPALMDADRKVRSAAAAALGNIGSPEAVNFLLTAFREHNAEVIAGADNFFIRRGEPGSEEALIEALDKTGDQYMAVDFLNSGNQKLHDAASSWASRNNYQITYSPGSGSSSWGDKQ
jgi:HEAT repeat protein